MYKRSKTNPPTAKGVAWTLRELALLVRGKKATVRREREGEHEDTTGNLGPLIRLNSIKKGLMVWQQARRRLQSKISFMETAGKVLLGSGGPMRKGGGLLYIERTVCERGKVLEVERKPFGEGRKGILGLHELSMRVFASENSAMKKRYPQPLRKRRACAVRGRDSQQRFVLFPLESPAPKNQENERGYGWGHTYKN